ncbi:MAG: hypothetical protein M3081_08255 [Gemmatimonadota bacterium]|nr:hypothetical protein [Gemmatimonadota bacterium]
MPTRLFGSRLRSTRLRSRRGGALLLMLFLSMSIAALAMSAIFLTSGSRFLSAALDREEIDSYAADAALALGKSRLEVDASMIPDSGFVLLLDHTTIPDADNIPIPGITATVYAGPSGSISQKGGRFVTLFAEIIDMNGAHTIRRLELVQESFARFGYWSNSENNICFGAGDNIYGPLFSNDVVKTCAGQTATFHDSVGTAQTVANLAGAGGVFMDGYQENLKPMILPDLTTLNTLIPRATSGRLNFTAPNTGTLDQIAMRLDFVTADLNGDGDTTDVNEGFVRAYSIRSIADTAVLRGAFTKFNCGAWFPTSTTGDFSPGFFPYDIHDSTWVKPLLMAGGMASGQADIIMAKSFQQYMSEPTSRCYPGGDPRLAPAARDSAALPYSVAARHTPGNDTTFSPIDRWGNWVSYPGVVSGTVNGVRPIDAAYLFPLSKALNPGFKGVIYVNGTVGVSGKLRSKITLYATGNIGILGDMRYQTDPSPQCFDMMGMISLMDIMVVDNAVHVPQLVDAGAGTYYKSLDDTPDAYIHSTVMALGSSFGAQNPTVGGAPSLNCGGTLLGRGCLYLTGSIIQRTRATVNGSAGNHGYAKRYSFDRCVLTSPPPFFPTSGPYMPNRFFEVDPGRFTDVAALYRSMSPSQ